MTVLFEEFRPHAAHFAAMLGPHTSTVGTYAELLAHVDTVQDELLVVFGPGTPLSDAVAFATECRLVRPYLGVLLLRPHLDVNVMGEALRAGVREVLDANDSAGIIAACMRSIELSTQMRGVLVESSAPGGDGNDASPAAGRIITVFAAKGGCGKTTIATNLAVALADAGRRVCIIDLDLAFGDVAIMLQLTPERTIGDAVPVADRIDQTGLRTMLTRYAPGIDTLLAPVQPAVAEQVSRHLIAEVLHLARGMFDDVIVDTPPQFNDAALAALDASHLYLLVATPELPALKNLRVALDMFDLLDYQRGSRVIVLNRADSKVGLSSSDIDRVIRTPIAAYVPSSREVPLSINRGVPLIRESPNHPVSTAIRGLASGRLAGEGQSAQKGLRAMMSRRAKR
jgi:pilus assembly protein CpaE